MAKTGKQNEPKILYRTHSLRKHMWF